MQKPLVSIVIPLYNGANYVAEAIDTALSQTYENIEIIVINDGSTDDGECEKVVLSYGDKVRYFKKENGGVSSALNFGISKMRGEYFSWLSHDDMYTKTKVADEVEVMLSSEEKKIVYCDVNLVDKNSKLIPKVTKKKSLIEGRNSWENTLRTLLLEVNLHGCAFLIPKEILDEVGGFEEALRYCQDSLMWYRIFLKKYPLYFVPTVGVLSRVHDKQLTQTGRALFEKDNYSMSRELIESFKNASTKEKNILFYYAKMNATYGLFAVLKNVKRAGKESGLFGLSEILSINKTALYGKIRPLIRRIYYKLFRKVKTN